MIEEQQGTNDERHSALECQPRFGDALCFVGQHVSWHQIRAELDPAILDGRNAIPYRWRAGLFCLARDGQGEPNVATIVSFDDLRRVIARRRKRLIRVFGAIRFVRYPTH